MHEIIGWCILALAIGIDLFSLFLNLRCNCKGTGQSGIPGISWFMYIMSIMIMRHPNVLINIRNIVGLTIFHACCHYFIPLVHLKILNYKKCSSQDKSVPPNTNEHL